MFILFFSIHLYFMFPYHDEGEMTTYRSSLVQNKTLAILAKVGLLDFATWYDILTLCMLAKNFSKQNFQMFFLFFLKNKIWHFMQIDNLHEVSDPIF